MAAAWQVDGGAAFEGHAILMRWVQVTRCRQVTHAAGLRALHAQKVGCHKRSRTGRSPLDARTRYVVCVLCQALTGKNFVARHHHVMILAVYVAHINPGAQAMVSQTHVLCLKTLHAACKGFSHLCSCACSLCCLCGVIAHVLPQVAHAVTLQYNIGVAAGFTVSACVAFASCAP